MSIKGVLGVCFAFCFFLGNAYGQRREGYSPYRLMGQFEENTPIQITEKGFITIENYEVNALLQEFDLQKIVPFAKAALKGQMGSVSYNHPFVFHFSQEIPVMELTERLMQTGIFKFVEPDFIGKGDGICEVAPNDSYYKSRQWGLNNTGNFDTKSVEDADIDMNHAWEITTGDTSVIVAILDSGIDPDHPEFKGRLWNNSLETAKDSIDDDGNGYRDDLIGWDFANHDNAPIDDNGHGMNVTGIIGATGNNSYGYAGVDWNCKLMTCKVLESDGYGFYSWWASAIYYAVDNGADVINMSLGGSDPSSAMETAIAYAHKKNVPIVVSMGNGNSKVTKYPAGYTLTIAVGATDTDNKRVSPFFWGGGSSYGEHIDLCAPGNYIYGPALNGKLSSYYGGTSQSAPLVTGVVSLLKGLAPNISIDSIETLLQFGAKDQVGRTTEDTRGWDIFHGHGVLNAYKTLLLTQAKTISACDHHTLAGKYFDSSAVIFDTISGGPSCSSLVATFINIKYSPERQHQISACDSFEWIDGKVYKSSVDQVKHLIPNSIGCDSVHLLSLDLNQSSASVYRTSACEPYTWIDGNTYTRDETSATYVIPNHKGCDSTIRLRLNMGRHSSSAQLIDACEPYTWIDGKTYANSGTFLASVVLDHEGCDSTVWLHLKLHEFDNGLIEKDQKLRAIATNATYQWLDCDAEKAPILGENAQEFSPTKIGNYAVAIEKDGCTDTSDCYYIISANLEKKTQPTFEIYPNPFTDHFKITARKSESIISVTLMNNLGETLGKKTYPPTTDMVYDLHEIPSGIYYVRLEIEDQSATTYKLVKK